MANSNSKIKRFFDIFNKPTDMTVGSPWKSIAIFTVPMLIGNIAQQLYSAVDTIVVGHFIGDNAISAVGCSMPVLQLLLVLFMGISTGATVMVSQYFGAKSKKELSYTIGNCIVVTAIACIILVAGMSPFIEKILVGLGTDPVIVKDCASYLMISLVGIAGMAYYNILSGIIRGLGDSMSALIYLLVATVINTILDIVFVADWGLGMGVGGAALATVIAQGVSSVLCLIKLLKMREHFEIQKKHFIPKAHFVKSIIRLGLPAGITQAIFSSAMLIVQSLTNKFGLQFVAANNIVMRVDGFAMMPNFSFGVALTTYAGQNVGAGKYDRVMKGAKQGTLMALGCSATITLVILLFGKSLMRLFTDTESLVKLSYSLMLILAVGYIAMAVTQSLSGVMRGAGDTMTPMWISLITTVAIRVPVAYCIAYLTSPTGKLADGTSRCIQYSLLSSWVIGAVLAAIFYKVGKWKNKAIN